MQAQPKVWHRCGTCGDVFADMQELQTHLVHHRRAARHPTRSISRPPKPSPLKTHPAADKARTL